MNNLVTIVICVYNGERYIEETLESIISQTTNNFKLLIINDCSTDLTVKLAESFLKRKATFEYEIHNLPSNGGLARARHFAEHHVKTKYIIFLDADDLLIPSAVEKMLAKIQSDPDLIAVGCYLDYIDKDSKKIKGGIYLGETTKEGFIGKAEKNKFIFMHPTSIFDVEAAISVGGHNIEGFPEGKPRYQDMCEDLELWTRMSDLYTQGKAIIVIPEVLCLYRKMDNTMSTNTLAMKLRMKHIKVNLIRRRNRESEISFIDFMSSIDQKTMKQIKRDVIATDCFRMGGFAYLEKKYIKAVYYCMMSFFYSPKYVYQKFKPITVRKFN